MKKLLLLGYFAMICCSGSLQSQNNISKFAGNWLGTLNVMGQKLRIGLSIIDSSGILSARMMSPDQGAMNISVSELNIKEDSLFLKSDEIQAGFAGLMSKSNDSISGYWKQGMKIPLKFACVDSLPDIRRPQEPLRPFPYKEEEVTFINKEGLILSGTLTLPAEGENFTAVILVSGSGPQNRDEELLGHKPFLVIADYLTRNGIAVLRYDDRGVGKSQGLFSSATTFDLADDAEAALEYLHTLQQINKNKTGIIGHSEGGLIAPIVASKNKKAAFIIMLAGPGLKGEELLLLQSELIARADSVPEKDIKSNTTLNKKIYKIVNSENDDEKAKTKIRKLINSYFKKLSPEEAAASANERKQIEQMVYVIVSPWLRTFMKIDPKYYLQQVSCPVLALNGSLDLQVPSAPNLQSIDQALRKGNNPKYSIKECKDLNHLFQHAITGSPAEYLSIEETIAPEVLEEIKKWINSL